MNPIFIQISGMLGKKANKLVDKAAEKYPEISKKYPYGTKVAEKVTGAGLKIMLILYAIFIAFFIIGFLIFIAGG